MDTTTHQNLSLTKLLSNTAQFMFHHFLALLVGVAAPLLASYAVVWVTAGAVVNELKSVETFEQAAAIFNFTSATSYTLLIIALLVLAINLIGFIAGPLVTLREGKIPLKNIFRESLKYFGSFVAFSLILAASTALVLLFAFIVILIVITLVGFIDANSIAIWEGNLMSFLPDVLLLILTIAFQFAPYFIIDKQMSAWPAVLASASLMRHHFLSLTVRFVFIAALILVAAFIIELIPVVGGTLAYILALMIVVVYDYYIYKALTASNS